MKMNKFVFIIPFRNVENYIEDCAYSLLSQSNSNWIAIFCDDASSDDSVKKIPNDPRFIIKQRTERITALPNIHYGIIESNVDDEDIICLLDGDDFLLHKNVLDIIDSMYKDDTLLTYGQYIWPNGQIGHCKPYSEQEFLNLRNGQYWSSHMRTFRYKAYKEIMKQDPELSCFKNKLGQYYTITSDVAIMLPLMEIVGFNRIKFNQQPIYYYRLHAQNDHFVNGQLQKTTADEIFSKPSFKKIF